MRAVKTKPYLKESDFIDALSRPHTILVAAITLGMMLSSQWIFDSTLECSYRSAFYASCGIFLAFSCVYLPDSILIRPHPMIWRITLGLGVLYMMLMTFLFFLNIHSARSFFAVLDSSLKAPLEERLYATDCSITSWSDMRKITDALFDEFVIAHALGYWFKMMVMRDFWTVMALSLGFEVVECTLQYWLENFKECWWDHLLLDVLGCNLIGMILGYCTLRYFEMKEYTWVKVHDIQGIKKKALRITMQFTPREWHIQKWTFFNHPYHTLQVFFVVGTILMQEANIFLLKYLLWLPPTHPFVIARVGIFAFLAVPAVREFYSFCREKGSCKKLGPSAWVCCIAIFIETAVIIKYGSETGDYTRPFPPHVRLAWMISSISWAVWFVLRYWDHTNIQNHSMLRRATSWVFFFAPLVSFFVMCCMSTPGLEDFKEMVENFVEIWVKPQFKIE